MTPVELDALATRFFSAIEAGDVAAVADCYTDDVEVWHNFDQLDQPKRANLAVLTWLTTNVRNVRYDEIRRLFFEDGFVQQHVLRGTAPSGAALEVPAMMRIFVRDSRIHRIEEYLDSAQAAVLRAAP